ncbi:hypothetical protein TGP89_360390, partial [Toxoplasma gondii p89]
MAKVGGQKVHQRPQEKTPPP